MFVLLARCCHGQRVPSGRRSVPFGAQIRERKTGTLRTAECSNIAGTRNFDMGTILIILLLVLLLGAWPSWPYSRGWGYYPSGTLGLVLVIVLVLALMGRV
jgi:Protein of unknown function (DUF3309)